MTQSATPSPLLPLPSDQDSSGRTLGDREIELVTQVLRSGTLTSTKGSFVRRLEQAFAERLGVRFAYACSSGSAAVHAALSALALEAGDEVITTSITDMGALTPILYQAAVPVFAEVDPRTLNVTADSIRRQLSARTRAIIVTHLFGNPCVMDPIVGLAREKGIPIIEDSAQAFLASCDGKLTGTFGAIGCFSMQQGKHMTCGEGGLVVTDDPQLARRLYLFINKCYGYGDADPDHYYIALNSRLSEVSAAVALGQLEKLDECVRRREEAAWQLTALLADTPGISPFPVATNARHAYWKYCLAVDRKFLPEGADALARLLRAKGIYAAPQYIRKPAFCCEVFQKRRTFGSSEYPFSLARPEVLRYTRGNFPDTFAGLEQTLVLPWNERYTTEHVQYIADSIHEAVTLQCKFQETAEPSSVLV